MSYRDYLKKFETFMYEIRMDKSMGCYNKMISSMWFSIEALLKSILLASGRNPPEKAGRMISIFANLYFRGNRDLLKNLNKLYAMRKEIDHRKKIADKAYGEKAYKIFMDIMDKIKSSKEIPVKIIEKLYEIKF